MPFRQMRNHKQIAVASGFDERGFAIMASHAEESDSVIHLLIANANVSPPKRWPPSPATRAANRSVPTSSSARSSLKLATGVNDPARARCCGGAD